MPKLPAAFTLILLVWFTLTGCTVVRTVAMHNLAKSDIPLPPASKGLSIHADGRVPPSVTLYLQLPNDRDAAAAWFRTALEDHGWTITASRYAENNDPERKNQDPVRFEAYRTRHSSRAELAREELELTFYAQRPSLAEIRLTGRYRQDRVSLSILEFLYDPDSFYVVGLTLHFLIEGDPRERIFGILYLPITTYIIAKEAFAETLRLAI